MIREFTPRELSQHFDGLRLSIPRSVTLRAGGQVFTGPEGGVQVSHQPNAATTGHRKQKIEGKPHVA